MQYTVRPGDNLYSIAARFGVPVQTIMAANNITNPLQLFAGQTLYIPVGQPGQPGPGYPPPGPGVGGGLAQRLERLERQVDRQQREINELERRVRRLERP